MQDMSPVPASSSPEGSPHVGPTAYSVPHEQEQGDKREPESKDCSQHPAYCSRNGCLTPMQSHFSCKVRGGTLGTLQALAPHGASNHAKNRQCRPSCTRASEVTMPSLLFRKMCRRPTFAAPKRTPCASSSGTRLGWLTRFVMKTWSAAGAFEGAPVQPQPQANKVSVMITYTQSM